MFNFINRMGCTKAVAGAVGASSKDWTYTISLSINHPAAAANITVVTEGAATYTVTWGDGNVDSGVASGVQAANTYGSPYDGEVLIQSEGKILEISSTAGRWDFDVSALPATLTDLTVSDSNSSISGLSSDLPGSLENLDLSGTNADIQDEFGDGPATLVTLDLSDTNSSLIAFIANFPPNLEKFDVANSSVVLYGDLEEAPASLTELDASNTNSFITALSQDTTMTAGVKFIDLSDTNLGSDAVDDILIALANISSWSSPKTLDIGGNNAARTSASDAAVATLEGLGVTVTVNESTPVYDDITYIGVGTGGGGGVAQTVGVPAGVQEFDHLFIQHVTQYADTPSPPSGWTQLGSTPVTSGGTSGTTSCAITIYYKQAGASESSVEVPDAGVTNLCRMYAFRSADNTSLIDAQVVGGSSGSATDTHTIPGVTTTVPKAMVAVFVGFGDDSSATSSWANSDLESITEAFYNSTTSGSDLALAMAYGVKATAGTVGNTTVSSAIAVERAHIVIALTPTSSGGASLPASGATLSNNQAAGPVDLTITTHDASDYVVEWGDGAVSADIPSGSTASHTYADVYDGDVEVLSDGNITEIASSTGGWDFALTALPSTCTSLNLGNTDAAVTGTLSQLPSGMTDLQLFNTNSVITGDLGDEPSGMVTMYLSRCASSNIGGVSANMASTFVNLSLRETASDAAFNLANIPSGMRILRLHDSDCTVTGTAGTMIPTAFELAELQNLGLTEGVVDDILISFSDITSWSGLARVKVDGANAERSTDSNTAVSTLEGNGVTVSANGPVSPGTGNPPPVEPPPVDRVGIIVTGNSDNGEIYINSVGDDGWREELHDIEPYLSQCFKVVSAADPDGITPREGSHCMRFYWEQGWPLRAGKIRAELKRLGGFQYTEGDTIWLGFSIFFADDAATRAWIARTDINQSVIQYHEDGTGTAQLMARSDRWEFSFPGHPKQFCGNIVLGQWNDFVMNAKVTSGGDGFCKLWINADSDAETPVYNKTGRTLRPGITTLNFKIGIYNARQNDDLAVPYIQQYHDAYRIGDASSNFASVKPGS